MAYFVLIRPLSGALNSIRVSSDTIVAYEQSDYYDQAGTRHLIL